MYIVLQPLILAKANNFTISEGKIILLNINTEKNMSLKSRVMT